MTQTALQINNLLSAFPAKCMKFDKSEMQAHVIGELERATEGNYNPCGVEVTVEYIKGDVTFWITCMVYRTYDGGRGNPPYDGCDKVRVSCHDIEYKTDSGMLIRHNVKCIWFDY